MFNGYSGVQPGAVKQVIAANNQGFFLNPIGCYIRYKRSLSNGIIRNNLHLSTYKVRGFRSVGNKYSDNIIQGFEKRREGGEGKRRDGKRRGL